MSSPATPSTPPPSLSGRHRDTLRHILGHPVSHNVEWRAAVALLREVGAVDELREGGVEVTSGGRTLVLARPHGKDLDADGVVEVRRFLEGLGYRLDGG